MKPRAKPKRSAYDHALALLARREYSSRELSARLGRGGHSRDETAAALEKLQDENYQDDRRFGAMLTHSRAERGYGPRRIRAELRSHGLMDADIDQLLQIADTDWTRRARAQMQRHYGPEPAADQAECMRRTQYLLRRGFDAATVRHVTHVDVDEADDMSDTSI